MPLFTFLTDAAGNKNAVGDYAATATDFYIECPGTLGAGRLDLYRMIIEVVDFGTFDSGSYGNGISLSNGISVGVHNSSGVLVLDMTDGLPIVTNVDWARQCHDVAHSSFGTGNESMSVRWTFNKAGEPISLRPGWRLSVTLNDDFTDLIQHYFQVQGTVV